ncbi:unnamed protein product [Calypogeia fissa]
MCRTQSSWSSSTPGAFRHNYGSAETRKNYLADVFDVSRCSLVQKRGGLYVLAFLSLEVEPTTTWKVLKGSHSLELKQAVQIHQLGTRKTPIVGVLSSKGKKHGHGVQAVTEDETILQKQSILQLRRPPSAPKIELQTAIIEAGDLTKSLHVAPKVSKSQQLYRQKTLEFLKAEHPFRESRASVRKFQRCGPVVNEVVAALGKNGDAETVMANYHSISKTDISGILTEFQLRRDWRGAVQFFKWMKSQAWYSPNSRQYTKLIGFLGREGKLELACSHFQEMLLEKCKPDQYTFTAMVNAYGKAKMYNEALAVFSYMKAALAANCKPTTVTCNALFDSLVKGGKYDLAFKIFIDMREGKNGLDFRCKPNSVTYNILIDALCREGHVEAAVQVIYNMREGDEEHEIEPNVSTYNTLINACGKSGLYDKAEALLEHMIQHGYRPDRITYTALIDAYGKAGQLESAENMFMGMRSSDIQVDIMAYTAMVDAYAREGHHQKAEGLFKMMRESGIKPNHITYLALMDAYGKGGLPLAAQEVFLSMEKEGHQANVLHYSSLINAYGKVNMYAEAADVYKEMKRSNCEPNCVTLSAILTSITKCNSWDAAEFLLQCFQSSGNELERALYNLLMPEESLWEPALETLDNISESKPLCQSLYNALMDLLWRFDMKARAAKVVTLSKQHGIYTDAYFKDEWNLDLHGLSVAGAMLALLKWLDELHVACLWGENVPGRLRIITGKGKHSRAKTSALKLPVENLLLELHAPFVSKEEDYRGFLVASGDSVRAWLMTPGIKQKLQLT